MSPMALHAPAAPGTGCLLATHTQKEASRADLGAPQAQTEGAGWSQRGRLGREEAVVREEWGGKARTDRQPVPQSPGTPRCCAATEGASLGAGPQLQVPLCLGPDQICRLEFGTSSICIVVTTVQ